MWLFCQGVEPDAVGGKNGGGRVVSCFAVVVLITMVVDGHSVGAAWDFVPQGVIAHTCGLLGRSTWELSSLGCREVFLDVYGGIVGCGGRGGTPSASKVAMVGDEIWKIRTAELIGLYVERM